MPPSSERARRFLFLGDKNEVNLNRFGRKSEGVVFLYIYPHEFSTESYLLLDASWKLIALIMVLPVVISVIGVIAYVLINRYFPRISYWISGR